VPLAVLVAADKVVELLSVQWRMELQAMLPQLEIPTQVAAVAAVVVTTPLVIQVAVVLVDQVL
jgi:uncharacterized membrane protein YidH (DUF202 family)